MNEQEIKQVIEESKPKLIGLAYRILGSYTEAEDAVQETFLKWQKADQNSIQNHQSWLMTVCTRQCIDVLKSSHQTRVEYFGTWLPEPIQTGQGIAASDQAELSASLTTAFLLMLDRLSPKERAAYLLHDIFSFSYDEICETLNVQNATSRKLVSRARTHISQSKNRYEISTDKQQELLQAFLVAINTGELHSLQELLANDISLSADSGGKVPSANRILSGKDLILRFFSKVLIPAWDGWTRKISTINGFQGLILSHDDNIEASISFAFNQDEEATDIYIMRNPDKLNHLTGNNLTFN